MLWCLTTVVNRPQPHSVIDPTHFSFFDISIGLSIPNLSVSSVPLFSSVAFVGCVVGRCCRCMSKEHTQTHFSPINYKASNRDLRSGSIESSTACSSVDNCSPTGWLVGTLSPTILESISTPSSARTWLVTCSASSSISSLSKASTRASSMSSCLRSIFSFSIWNSCRIFVVSLMFNASLVVFMTPLTLPMAAAAETCVAIAVALMATAPSWAFCVMILSR
mmetsp:Transcript_13441/g.37822  ORF Transcript_13441/g.37822 Transcript_13441/m.37822 type:complete len:221 (-) Transcript_13441:599-1261(-)